MLIVLANELPPAVRGRMKLWFIEPRPNVFISGLKDSVAITVIDYLYEHCPSESGILIIRLTKNTPGFEIRTLGCARKPIVELSGLQLVLESLKV